MPRWPRCQSLAQPSSALYWHIGETTMRLASSSTAELDGREQRWTCGFLAGADGWPGDHKDDGARGKRSHTPANYVRVAIQMTCRAPPRDPLARALTSSTAKPALPRRQVNFGFGPDDHTASTPPGRSAARAALNPFRSYSASLAFRVRPSGPLSTSSRIASKADASDRIRSTDVGFADADPRIGQAVAEHLRHRPPRPSRRPPAPARRRRSGRPGRARPAPREA